MALVGAYVCVCVLGGGGGGYTRCPKRPVASGRGEGVGVEEVKVGGL